MLRRMCNCVFFFFSFHQLKEHCWKKNNNSHIIIIIIIIMYKMFNFNSLQKRKKEEETKNKTKMCLNCKQKMHMCTFWQKCTAALQLYNIL